MNFSTLAALDHQYLWHPFTQQQEWVAQEPLIIVSGKGAFLRDIHGNDYFDGNSSIWTNIHGHAHPRIVEAIADQAARLDHTSFLGTTHPTAILLAKKLIELFPAGTLSRVFFSDNGSSANEVALKMTLQYWQLVGHPERSRFVSFTNAYHGDTVGAASLGGRNTFSQRFSQIHFSVEQVSSLRMLEEIPHPQTIAGIILEPLIQGVAGMRPWPPGMLQAIRKFCDEHDILLLLDEVMTGFGRTGRMFACEQEGVFPDFLALAKGLSGGALPIAATLTSEKIYEAFLGTIREEKTFYYGHSYTANPIAAAAALASLAIFEEESVLEKLPSKIQFFSHSLKKLASLPHIGSIRQCGLIAGIELMEDPLGGIAYPPARRQGAHLCHAARQYGLLTRPILDTIVLMPPLCSTEEEIDYALNALVTTVLTHNQRY